MNDETLSRVGGMVRQIARKHRIADALEFAAEKAAENARHPAMTPEAKQRWHDLFREWSQEAERVRAE